MFEREQRVLAPEQHEQLLDMTREYVENLAISNEYDLYVVASLLSHFSKIAGLNLAGDEDGITELKRLRDNNNFFMPFIASDYFRDLHEGLGNYTFPASEPEQKMEGFKIAHGFFEELKKEYMNHYDFGKTQ